MSGKKVIIIVLVLIAVIAVYLSFSKKPEPKYTTADVTKGEVLQTVSATGTAEAATKLNLSFINSGRVQEINVKVGDRVESGAVLAKLDTNQLESQLDQANANLSSANADLNKLLKGATPEDLRLSETAVANAQTALDNANQSLVDTKIGTERDIASAEASLNNAQTTLDNADKNLENVKISNESNLNQDYDNSWDTIDSSLVTASNSLNTNKTTLEYEDAQDTLSVLNMQYLNNSESSKIIADSSYVATRDYVESIRAALTHEKIDEALLKSKTTLEDIRKTLGDTSDVLQSTITSSKLTQAELDTLRSNVSTARSNTNAAIVNITTAQQNISSQKISNQTNLDNAQATINSAKSSLMLSEQSLSAVRSSATSKINASQNAVKSAEGALRQAQDQLALKKAGPRKEDVSSYQSQVKKAQANADLIRDQISDSTLTSPQKGIVTEINGEIGELTSSGKVFISIITADNFEIKANISEVDISKVKISDEVKITFDALGPDKEFKGNIVSIDPAQTEISGVIYYKVTTMFSANAEIIKPGMTANLDIMTAKKDNVILIPFQALKEKDGAKYVQILENGKARDVSVDIGLKGDVNLEVTNGLSEGQKVITFTEGGK